MRPPTVERCTACGAAFDTIARFCGVCGAARDGSGQADDGQADGHGVVPAIATLFVGTLLALIVLSTIAAGDGYELGPSLAATAAFALIAAIAGALLGMRGLRRSFGAAPNALGVALGFVVGAACIAVNVGYVYAVELVATIGSDEVVAVGESETPSLALLLVTLALLPALVEEWMCRGVMWEACRRATGVVPTILATATLFGLLHALGPGGLLYVPNRLATGVLLGWLRHRTGGLVPPMAAHFLNNAAAAVLVTQGL